MSSAASIKIIRGPDEGKVFSLDGEMINLGRGEENEVALSDESLDDYQASIVRKNGRYAIYTPLSEGVLVDGSGIPSDQWVWLPETAQVSFRDSTVLQFSGQVTADKPVETNGADPPSTPPAAKMKRKRRRKRKAGQPESAAQGGRKVAKFITDREGDRLVRLGEDGALPELALTEAAAPKKTARKSGESGSPLIYVAVGVSLLMSLAMLFIDSDSGGASASELQRARQDIRKYHGTGDDLKPYQQYLREAQRAHASGDRRAERRAYQKVLDELNAEDVGRSISGLTGDKDEDDKLREMIGILLNRRR